MDLGIKLEETHVPVTGGSGYIGIATVDALLAAGCYVTSLDIKEPDPKLAANSNFRYHYCDITSEDSLEEAFDDSQIPFGFAGCRVALASLDLSVLQHHESMADMTVAQWRRTH
jgi:NAD(P)-dependent dehydrogenase (short-subunit alcohol dehydrogenase family)